MAQDVIYPGEGSMCTLEKVEIHCFGMNCPIGEREKDEPREIFQELKSCHVASPWQS